MKRTRGRRRVDDGEESRYVGVTLPAPMFDEYCKRAIRESVSVPEVIRRDLRGARAAGKDTTTGRQR